MPSIRIGYSTDFNLNNELVGIGSTTATSTLDVAGQIIVDKSSGSGGISSFREYQGFLQSEVGHPGHCGLGNIVIDSSTSGNLNNLSDDIAIGGEVTVSTGTTITGGRLDTLTVSNRMSVPHGDTNSREGTVERGTTRFNQDFGTLEFFDGYNWKTLNSYSRGGSSRAYFTGGAVSYPSTTASIDLVNIQSTGGAQEFGNLLTAHAFHGTCSSSTRGVVAGNGIPSSNTIEYFTLANGGNSADFGDQATQRYGIGGCSSSTRGLWAGGWTPSNANSNVIDYIEIVTTGNALDFGDLTIARRYASAMSSPVRGVWIGGIDNSNVYTHIDYITITSKGNGLDFGDCAASTAQHAGCSNSVRGIASCSAQNAGENTQFQTITISSTGNAIYFGDLNQATYVQPGMACDQTRAVHGGGFGATPSTASISDIFYITISVGGLGLDFGDLTEKRSVHSACSDSHGGLGGF